MFAFIKSYFQNQKRKRLCKALLPGQVISKFVARDIKREIRILSIDEINIGFVIIQRRTFNVLYMSKGLIEKQSFGLPKRIKVNQLWD